MLSIELKKSICRILADLVKSDNVISVDEISVLEMTSQTYEITDDIRIDSYSMSLADAAAYVAIQKKGTKNEIIKLMQECALKDGECCREEALLISALEIENTGKGRILSMPIKNRPILSSQFLFVDTTYSPRMNELDKNYEELSRIVEMAGFELVYIPKVANDFKEHKTEDLKHLLSLVNPTLKESALVSRVMSLRDMDSRYFFLQVLNGKLQMGLTIENPSWLIRLPNSVVCGRDYANYLCFDVEMDNIKSQLVTFIERINSRQRSYTITVNQHTNREKDFLYSGFHKALLDVMALDLVQPWEIKVYVRAGGNPVIDNSEPGKKFSIEICRSKASYPVFINGREAAFYILLLCGSAGTQKGIDFEYESERSKRVQAQYEAAYHLVSNRDSHFPDITLSSTFRPIKARVMKSLEDCGIKGEIHLFKPTKRGKNTFYIPYSSGHVKIITPDGTTPLEDSTLFRTFCRIQERTSN